MAWTRGQWPDAIITGDIRYSLVAQECGMGEWYSLCDDSHGIPIFGSVRDGAGPNGIQGQTVKVFNYPGQTEAIAAELVKRWNAYQRLIEEIDCLRAQVRQLEGGR